MIFGKLSRNINYHKDFERRRDLYSRLLRHEAEIGGQIFGPVTRGGRREFFCLDKRTWVWHEEWTDEHGQRRYATTRYDMRPGGVFKSQNGSYLVVSPEEARNLLSAIKLYEQRVSEELYSFAN